ncbi:relaxase/mobilization nuclease domain-containing protein [Galbibacter sp. EGI 63066]|uniref:relaxase/mobilization nuclease domain-containing protein n=1 Tax=Galbibacter sp. EGI 63066 TaxID=2993559 RepID=UPI002248C772|nr:relaxase/mobilization nuclease domain-containing protein [Galbibacter sp. EGI 63066]MCX2678892.1 relaxase/mobilization nuclease domain-containing protein [Galbibacter sp. EGI 63066]
MIGKGSSIAHTRASMQYGWNQEKDAEVVYRQHLCGENPKEITKEFQTVQQTNARCRKNTLSFVLSPTIEDGQRLKQKQLSELTRKFTEQMNLKEHQAIAFVHRDKKHLHVHLYVNRIGFDGKAYNDSYIGKKSQLAAEKVAQQMQLTTARQVQQEKQQSLLYIRGIIKRNHERALQHRPKSVDHYIKLMQEQGVKVIPSINKSNQLQGFRFEYGGHNLKGSGVHRDMSGGKILLAISQNTEKGLKASKDNTLKILNQTVTLSTNLATSIAKKVAKQVIKKAIDTGIGIGY